MKKMKKIIAILVVCVIAVSCGNSGVYAEESVKPRGNYEPTENNVVLLPQESGNFNYSFANKSRQYSDFIISPQNDTTGIRMSFSATSETHSLTLKVIRYDTEEVIYSTTVSVLNGFEQTIYLYSGYFETYRGYYIELSNPTISGASGQFTITN